VKNIVKLVPVLALVFAIASAAGAELQRFEPGSLRESVVVEKGDELAPGFGDAAVAGGGQTDRALLDHADEAARALLQPVRHRARVIG